METDSDKYSFEPGYLLFEYDSEQGMSNDEDDFVKLAYPQSLIYADTGSKDLSRITLFETSDSAYLSPDIGYRSNTDDYEHGPFILGSQITDLETGAELTIVASMGVFGYSVSSKNLVLLNNILSGYETTESTVSIDVKDYMDVVDSYYLKIYNDTDSTNNSTVYMVDSSIVASTLEKELSCFQIE